MSAKPPVLPPAALVAHLRAQLPKAARVYVPGVAAEPYALADAFANQPGLADGLTFFGVWIPGVNRTDWSAVGGDSRFETIFLGPELRDSFEAGRIDVFPLTYTKAWDWLASCRADAAIVQVSPPDADGRCSLSLSCDFTPAIWERANVRIAQINPALPPLPGAPSIPLTAFDAVTELDTTPRGYDAGRLPPAFEQIASHIASLVPDGGAVQFGLGKVQLAVLPALKHHRGMTIHTGMISDPLLEILRGHTEAAIRTAADPAGHPHPPQGRRRGGAGRAGQRGMGGRAPGFRRGGPGRFRPRRARLARRSVHRGAGELGQRWKPEPHHPGPWRASRRPVAYGSGYHRHRTRRRRSARPRP